MKKTNAMRCLDGMKIPYEVKCYDDRLTDGLSVAEAVGEDPHHVYKTLVAQGTAIHIFVIKVGDTLDLKKAAGVCGEKKLMMLPVNALQSATGYVRGGCTALALKKPYPVYLSDREIPEKIVVSAGVKGQQMKLKWTDYVRATKATVADIVMSQGL